EAVAIYRPLPPEAYAHVRRIHENRYQVSVLETNGSVCLTCRDFSVRPLPDPLRNFFFVPRWAVLKPEPADPGSIPDAPADLSKRRSEKESILLLYPPNRLGLEKSLAACHREDRIYRIRLGDRHRQSGRTWEVDVSDANGLERCIGRIGPFQRIYFLGGIEAASAGFDDPAGLDKSQDRGVVSLLRLIQALVHHDRIRHKPRLIIVTNDVYPVVSDDRVRPFAGSIPGLSRVIAKEYPELRVACFDIRLSGIAAGRPSEDIQHLADRIFRESRNPRNPESTAIRKGLAYERRIEPVSLEPAGGVPFQENGVYLIVGGAGGIGSALGRYLAERVRARLVLVGRRPVHTRVAQVLETIRTHGGEGHYLRADITDEAASARMVQEALSRYGHINGVFHSALLLMDRTVGNLTEADFKTVLSPKGIGTLNLFRALKPVHPDFMMVFSSAQSFICNPGQASYAAASTLQDALVAFLQQEAAYPIHLVNWGYWGSVGIVSNDATRKRMQEQGVGSIEPGEGMEAVRRILSHGPAQALCIKAENRFLESLGISRETGDDGAPLISPSRPESTAPESSIGFDEPVPEKAGPDHGKPVSEESLRETALNFLKGIFSKTLKMDKDRLDPHATFENYGIDSLVVLEINRDLEKVFGRLRATLLFEHKTLAALTDYFMANHRTALTPLFRSSKAPDGVRPMTGATAYPNDTRPAMGRRSERLDLVRSDGDSRIAVVGLSGRYPMAESLDAFWRNLMTGRRCIREIPEDRWDWKSLHGPETGIYSRWGGFMDGVDRFDPLFFNISPREAKTMDPQERLFLQTAHAAFEDAGYSRRRLERGNCRVGVFVGVMNCNYEWLGGNAVARGHSTTAGSAYWSVANRVSYFFDLTGPSLAVDTACSASLTAVHLACDSIRDGSCDMALAGGVNLILHPMHFQRLCQMNMLASDEFCRCFGDAADGFVDGEGVGALVLKPLDRALQDRDPIYGIILASAINAGGKTSGYSVPNPNAQADLIEATLRKAGVAPETISYVEAHGTGTELGDPIEITGLTQAFERFSRSRTQGRCAVGSVKSNIGHLEAAAGIAGITKVLLQMRHGRLAPTINAEVPNPHIPFEDTPFFLQREASAWKRPVIQTPEGETIVPRRAGISSFGAGGANAHLILEEFQEPAVAVDRSPLAAEPQIIVLSAKNEDRLKAYAERMIEFLEIHHSGFENPNPSLADIAYTLQTGRDAMEERLALVAGSLDDLRDTLFRYVNGGQDVEDLFTGHVSRKGAPSSVRKADSIDADFLNRLLIQRELRKIAMLWVSGYEIDWERLHPDPPPVRISLPSYPFAGERYWIPVDAAPATPSTDAPAGYLIDGIDTKTSLDRMGISFRKRLKRSQDMVAGHQFQEQAVLSGSVVLSMVHEAASLALDRMPFRLTRGTWLKPLSLASSDPEKDAFVFIRPRGEHYRYEVRTRHGKGWVTHASGKIERLEPADPIPQVDVESIQSGCRSHFDRESVYERFGSLGLRYGPYFHVLDEIWVGEKQALARFALSPQQEGKPADAPLEPALLDGAFQAMAGFALVRPQGDPAPLMPFAFEAFQLHHPLPKAGYIHVRCSGADRYDLAVLDDTGNVCSTISSVALKKEADGLHRMFFKPAWRPCDVETGAESSRTQAPQKVLLVRIGDRGDSTIAASLGRLHAGDTVHTLWVDGPDRGNAGGYRSLDSADPEAFQLGLSDVESPDIIYYLAGLSEVTSDPTDFSGLATARNRLLILFRLIQTLSRSGKLGGQRSVALNIVTCDLQDVPGRVSKQPLAGGLIGFARSLANEVPGLGVRCIDCSSDVTAETVGSDPYDAWLRPVISREIEPGPVRETALSGGAWYERMLEPIRLPSVGEAPFRQGGVYLILGGSGRIGLVLSRYLAQTVGAKLIWVGRSPWSDTLRKKRDLIRSLGGEARYVAADASDPEALATAVQEARARFGKIDGAFHCAVSEASGLVDDMTEESFAAGLAPKLAGSLAFHQAIGPEPVDFLIFFSSSQSFIGDRGLSAYAAGCAATDALAGYLDRRMPYPVLSINWGVWETEPGMEADAFYSRTRALGFKPIAPEEAMEALARILARPLHQILVLKAAERLLQRIGVSDSHRIERYPVQMPS
ncbi:MAG: SDR family NAD(P)-dependent oxidoreductase, partial [Desulfobacteraceae bacterium]|nr:SDR family NAD(P)-dependent oxidoreductase [Desulfobacteraceae bacterium]